MSEEHIWQAVERVLAARKRAADLVWNSGRQEGVEHVLRLSDPECRAVLMTVLSQVTEACNVPLILLTILEVLANQPQEPRTDEI